MNSTKHRFITLFFVLTLLIAPQSQAQIFDKAPNGTPNTFADIVDDLLPSVVNISSTQKATQPRDFPELPQFPEGSPFEDFFEEFMDRRGGGRALPPAASLGSGFVINAEKGYVVTNHHVVDGADKVKVIFQDDETVDAEIIGSDEKTDLAILKIDPKKHALTAVNFGNSDIMRVGDWIVAIGNPFGLGGTVTAGIISARQRDINAGPYDDFIQTDASINRGNSGGPMFNLKGEVIGINTAIFSPSGGSVGIGFAIPSAMAKPVIDQIIKYGRTRRGWLGVRIQQVTDEIAESLQLGKAHGALIAGITKGSPASKADIQPGDIITKFASQKIKEMRDLPRLVASTEIDKPVTVTLWRNGKEVITKVTIGELEKAEEDGLTTASPKSQADGTQIGDLGMRVEPINETLRTDYEIPRSVNGVVIINIDPDSGAAEKDIMEGDVIVEVNQQTITTAKDVKDIVNKAKTNGRSSVLLLVNRSGDVRFVALKLNQK